MLFLKGLLLGVTAVTPGISIGTMALSLNVYQKTLESVLLFLSPANWRKKDVLKKSFIYIVHLASGTVIAMVLFSSVLSFLFVNYAPFLRFAFVGVIIGSIPHIVSIYVRPSFSGIKWLLCALYVSIGLVVVLLLSAGEIESLPVTSIPITWTEITKAFLFGTISAAVGVIPGISGSYVLLLLGYYSSFLYIISKVILPLFIPILLGSVLGLLWVAFLVNMLLKKVSGYFVCHCSRYDNWLSYTHYSF